MKTNVDEIFKSEAKVFVLNDKGLERKNIKVVETVETGCLSRGDKACEKSQKDTEKVIGVRIIGVY